VASGEFASSAEERVQDLIVQFANSWRRTLALAIELGEALRELKGELGHGNWLPWVEEKFPYGERMARRFMDLAANRSEMSDLPVDTPFTSALDWLREQRRNGRPVPEPESKELEEQLQLLRFAHAEQPTATLIALILRVLFPDARNALDVTYGSGAFWDGSAHVKVTAHDLDPRRVPPDGLMNFLRLTYANDSFDVVIFDPPHLADTGDASIMGERFGTYQNQQLGEHIAQGTLEAWRVARLGIVCKVTDHVHGHEWQEESSWVRGALEGLRPYDVVHQVRDKPLVAPMWREQLSAYNNGSTYLIFRKGDQKHVRRSR